MINDLPGELEFNLRGVERELECPANNCGDLVSFGEDQVSVTCPSCQAKLGINVDAEFVNGHWRDKTTLYQL